MMVAQVPDERVSFVVQELQELLMSVPLEPGTSPDHPDTNKTPELNPRPVCEAPAVVK